MTDYENRKKGLDEQETHLKCTKKKIEGQSVEGLMSHVENPRWTSLIWTSSIFSPPLPKLFLPDMSSAIDSSKFPTDGTGKLCHIIF